MPDYNPKDVPILNDIIKNDDTDNNAEIAIEDDFSESNDAEINAAEYDINQFLAEPAEQDTDSTVSDETEPQPYELNDVENDTTIIDVPSVEPAPQVSVEPIALELIVKDIVKQLMPDLEQQLILLLQQALEDKLAEDINISAVKSADTGHEI